ncbi:hepatoma-derived growth factor [Drosophila elegans]|uniref:hepatoma-derived growth factor n=1 Tax=Drosophila elegans TaxID=30023 RepID=UPI0007E76760|nr:hepatoma-derived growth factor [Drosophila elegans]
MGRHRPRLPLFTIGDFVFAKVRGYRAWPARILDRVSSTSYNVYFYGTCNHAKVPRTQICDFERHVRRLGVVRVGGHASNPSFRAAMHHARQAFANPEQDFGFYQQLALNDGDCVNAEDLRIDYMVGDEDQEQPSREQHPEEQVSMDQLEEQNSGDQLEEQRSEGFNSKTQVKQQNLEGLDGQNCEMTRLTALNSKKLDTNHQLEELEPEVENSKKQKDRPLVQPSMPDLEEPDAKEMHTEEQLEEQDSVAQIPKDAFGKPDSQMQYSVPQLDSLSSDGLDSDVQLQMQERLEEEVQELMKMLKDVENQARREQVQDSEKQHLEELHYFMDQPLNLSCRRRPY